MDILRPVKSRVGRNGDVCSGIEVSGLSKLPKLRSAQYSIAKTCVNRDVAVAFAFIESRTRFFP